MLELAIVGPCRCGRHDVHGHLVAFLNTRIWFYPFWSTAGGIYTLGEFIRARVLDDKTTSRIFQQIESLPLPMYRYPRPEGLEYFALDLSEIHVS